MTLTREWRSGIAIGLAVLAVLAVFVWGNQRHAQADTLAEQVLCQVDIVGDALDGATGIFPMFDEDCEDVGGEIIDYCPTIPDVQSSNEPCPDGGTPPTDAPECFDGIDNEPDGKTDWGLPDDPDRDPGCSTPTDDSEDSDTPTPPPTDMCPNIGGTQESVPAGKVLQDGNCVDAPSGGGDGDDDEDTGGGGNNSGPACQDGIDNDNDGTTDFPADEGCSSADDDDEIEHTSSGGSSRRSSSGGGEVLGVATECAEYLQGYIKLGAQNNVGEVAKLQQFLNDFEGTNLAVTGTYDNATYLAVHTFQKKHMDRVLAPWGVTKSTGYVYHTTRKAINEIYCQFQKDFPLTQAQTQEIARVRAQGAAQGSTGASAPAKPITSQVNLQGDEPAAGSAPLGTPSQSAAAANATSTQGGGGNWWSNFWGWVFKR